MVCFDGVFYLVFTCFSRLPFNRTRFDVNDLAFVARQVWYLAVLGESVGDCVVELCIVVWISFTSGAVGLAGSSSNMHGRAKHH